MDAKKLAKQLIRDDLSRAPEVRVERQGDRAYYGWLRAASDAGDLDTLDALRTVDQDDFAREWENEYRRLDSDGRLLRQK